MLRSRTSRREEPLDIHEPDLIESNEDEIDPDAKFGRKELRITNEKVSVPTTDLPHNRPWRREQRRQLRAQYAATLGDEGEKFGFVVHAGLWGGRRWPRKPEAFQGKENQTGREGSAVMLRGRRMIIEVPSPGSLSAHTRPPWS